MTLQVLHHVVLIKKHWPVAFFLLAIVVMWITVSGIAKPLQDPCEPQVPYVLGTCGVSECTVYYKDDLGITRQRVAPGCMERCRAEQERQRQEAIRKCKEDRLRTAAGSGNKAITDWYIRQTESERAQINDSIVAEIIREEVEKERAQIRKDLDNELRRRQAVFKKSNTRRGVYAPPAEDLIEGASTTVKRPRRPKRH